MTLSTLEGKGIRLQPNHICVGGGCSISVTDDFPAGKVVISHKLGDRRSSVVYDFTLQRDASSRFSALAGQALRTMHIDQGGSSDPQNFRLTAKEVTSYISPGDAINIATEIFSCTGQRITIKAGGQKSRKSEELLEPVSGQLVPEQHSCYYCDGVVAYVTEGGIYLCTVHTS